ncbi:hypothetical protein [Methylobacterium sp. NEAU K]|uniref:hypothetical protein n=1 Tax=Methylobacterium sp. NEAU K TaxID=3064946 RepID=UPI002735E814|nr:hypothetical protein [Methylobacterium sp. NEAU K]MDP4005598.1 hypothetical protein [Methylobacterium sp. NEAU K]
MTVETSEAPPFWSAIHAGQSLNRALEGSPIHGTLLVRDDQDRPARTMSLDQGGFGTR